MDLKDFRDRYGVSVAVLTGMALLIALLPGNAPSQLDTTGTSSNAVGSGAAGSPGSPGGPGATAGGAAGAGGGGVTGAPGAAGGGAGTGGSGSTVGVGGPVAGPGAAPAASTVVFGQGPQCRADGRQAGISTYMPPCVEWTGTDNGGATADGVTAGQVTVIRYLPQIDPATQAILETYKLSDDAEQIQRIFEALFDYSNAHYQTYGREVVFQNFPASGASENDEAMIADAIAIADQRPFAVIEGIPAAPMPTVLIRELATRGVLCLCSTTLSTDFYRENPLVVSTGLPTVNEHCEASAEYVAKRLAGRNAVHAGDELNPLQGFNNTPRVFGLLYLNGARGKVDPEGERGRAACEAAFARYGIAFAVQVGYLYDPGRNQNDVSNMIAQMKDAGVTTIIPIIDPLSPILITPEATRQAYFPEWFITGTGLSDTTTAGRLYDDLQWSHAFGISPLWVTWIDARASVGYREYHHGRPADPDGAEGVLINIYRARIQTLFRGIHMAGPTLTHESFRQGLFSFPPTPAGGGTAALPFVYHTPDSPTDIKDWVEVYFDTGASGPDERGEAGLGMMMKTDNGRRYQTGQFPTDEPHVYQGGIAISDSPDGGTDPPHEQDGHTHPDTGCLSCTGGTTG